MKTKLFTTFLDLADLMSLHEDDDAAQCGLASPPQSDGGGHYHCTRTTGHDDLHIAHALMAIVVTHSGDMYREVPTVSALWE